jgi:hypothetical protein
MSRNTIYRGNGITVFGGFDHALGKFYQIFDKKMEDETPEQEGLVFDWSELFGFEINLTGIPDSSGVNVIIEKYIEENKL